MELKFRKQRVGTQITPERVEQEEKLNQNRQSKRRKRSE